MEKNDSTKRLLEVAKLTSLGKDMHDILDKMKLDPKVWNAKLHCWNDYKTNDERFAEIDKIARNDYENPKTYGDVNRLISNHEEGLKYDIFASGDKYRETLKDIPNSNSCISVAGSIGQEMSKWSIKELEDFQLQLRALNVIAKSKIEDKEKEMRETLERRKGVKDDL